MIKYKRKTNEDIKGILEAGTRTDFWEIILNGIDENIERIEGKMRDEELRKLPAEQYKLENELLKMQIDYLKYLKELPDLIKQSLGSPDNSTPDFDPYEK